MICTRGWGRERLLVGSQRSRHAAAEIPQNGYEAQCVTDVDDDELLTC